MTTKHRANRARRGTFRLNDSQLINASAGGPGRDQNWDFIGAKLFPELPIPRLTTGVLFRLG